MFPALFVKKRLEDQSGGNLVNDAAVLLPGMTGFVENLVRFAGRQALVPQVDGQSSQRTQFGRESLRLYGSRALLSRHVQRIAHHNGGHAEPSRKARQGAEVFTRVAPHLKSENRLRREPQFVRYSHAYALRTDVEAEVPGWWCAFQLGTPAFQRKATAWQRADRTA